MSFKTLVLNADYKPLSYFPLSICNWKESIKAVFLEKVSVVSEYNEIVRSPSIKIKIPSKYLNLSPPTDNINKKCADNYLLREDLATADVINVNDRRRVGHLFFN